MAKPVVIEEWYDRVPRSIKGATVGGLVVCAAVFGGFGAWASTAPLAAAVVVQGSFVATGQNKLVQHLEGGIINQIMVKEGEHVRKGQTLMTLDETASHTAWRRLLLRLARFEAQAARLQATALGKEKIDFTAIRVSPEDKKEIAEIIDDQTNVFDAGVMQLNAKLQVIDRNLDSLRSRLDGNEAQKAAVNRQIELIGQELEAKRILFDKGLYRRSELFAVQRAAAEAEGAKGRLEAEIGDNKSQIQRLLGQIEQTQQEYRQKAVEDLQGVMAEIDDMREQMHAAENVLDRTEVRAPVDGTLVRLFYHTTGGVIEGGKQIAEILPEGENLVIEAPVKPTDIDDVRVGQKASVRLTSFNQRTTPQVIGTLTYVSADTVVDPKVDATGKSIYVARVVIDDDQMDLIHHLVITPGMPAELFVETDTRTFLEYLTKPVKDSMERAFREK